MFKTEFFQRRHYGWWRISKIGLSVLVVGVFAVGAGHQSAPVSRTTLDASADATTETLIARPETTASGSDPKSNPAIAGVGAVATKPPTPSVSATTPTGPLTTINLGTELSGPDRILTNEYTHWNPASGCPYQSSTWDMTSGTLFVKNGLGYSGVPTHESNSQCDSSQKTNSTTFRLNTKRFNLGNIRFSLDYKVTAHNSDGQPANSYDGVHMWVGYQSEYALYSASVFRWDGVLVIKKKIPLAQQSCSDPSNGGCYVNLSSETAYPGLTAANVWHHAEITFSNAGSTSTITEAVDGKAIATVHDSGANKAPYASGAVGLRGDNSEFYFKNVTVVQL